MPAIAIGYSYYTRVEFLGPKLFELEERNTPTC